MWILESAFDGEQAPFQKLLKPGKEYHFGRKEPADLVIVDKTVSKESATIHVGVYEPSEEHKRPTLEIHAHKRQVRIITQEHEEQYNNNKDGFVGEVVSPDGIRSLEAGDTIVLTKSAPTIKVHWIPIVISVTTKISKEAVEQRRESCKSLGIFIERSKNILPNLTHLVLSSSPSLTIPSMLGVISAAHLITIEYVDEIIRKGESTLEKRFIVPNPRDFFPPDFVIQDMSKSEAKEALVANQRRKTLFVGTTFLLMHGGEGLAKSLESMTVVCTAAGGRVVIGDGLNVTDDESALRFLRSHRNAAQTFLADCGETASEAPDEGLVVICAHDDMQSDWCVILARMTRQSNIAMPPSGGVAISKSILETDARRYFNQMADSVAVEEPGQDDDKETLPPTNHQEQRKSLTPLADRNGDSPVSTFATERQPSPPPPPSTIPPTAAKNVETQKSPKIPRRRAEMSRRDPLEDIFGPSLSTSAVTNVDTNIVPPTAMDEEDPATQTQRLTARPRRHADPDNKRPRMSETWRNLFDSGNNEASTLDHEGAQITQVEESQSRTRKYRLELDEADRAASQGGSKSTTNDEETSGEKQVESQVESTRKRRALSPLREESQPAQRRQKQLEEMEENTMESNSPAPSTIPATAATTASENSAATVASGNDKKGNSDTDTKFLQAMATSKRSKKGLDQFDKEFNLLRIAKPARVTGHHGKIIADADDPEYRAWEQMGPSDFDINAAGNFVQIDFVPLVYHRSEEGIQDRARRQSELQGKWQGMPNFKKFRTKQRPQREPVAMDVSESMDYGMGDGYTRPPRASARAYVPVHEGEDDEDIQEVELMGPPPKPDWTRSKKGYNADPFSDEEESVQSRRSTQTASTSTQSRQRKKVIATQEEDNDQSQRKSAVDVRLDVDADLDDSIYRPRRRAGPPPPSSTSSSTVKSNKRSPIPRDSDDDSDDDSDNFSGFRKKPRR